MKWTTFEVININTNCTLVFNNILSIPVNDFTIGYGFDTLLDLPFVSKKHLVEAFSFIYLNDFVKGSDAEHFNNRFEQAMNKIIIK
jgi:hypothetical protein